MVSKHPPSILQVQKKGADKVFPRMIGQSLLHGVFMEPHNKTYQRANQSRLEQWRSQITSLRASGWPNNKIASILRAEHGVSVSGEAVRQFCNLRRISKGEPDGTIDPSKSQQPEKTVKKTPRTLRPTPPIERVFDYDESKPIILKRR